MTDKKRMKDQTTKAMAHELKTLVRQPEVRKNVLRVAHGLAAFTVSSNGTIKRRIRELAGRLGHRTKSESQEVTSDSDLKHDWHSIITGHGVLWCDRCGALKFPAETNQSHLLYQLNPNSKTGYLLPENLINHPIYDNIGDADVEGPCIDIWGWRNLDRQK